MSNLQKTERIIIVFGGTIGAGKSTASLYLTKKYGFTSLSYVDLIWKPILLERGMDINRENLQNLGDELREKYGIKDLAKMIIPFVSQYKRIVIDDIRDPDAYYALAEYFGESIFLVFIDTKTENRVPRLKIRDNLKSIDELRSIERRKTETKISLLKPIANYIIKNNGSLHDYELEIQNCIKKLLLDIKGGIYED